MLIHTVPVHAANTVVKCRINPHIYATVQKSDDNQPFKITVQSVIQALPSVINIPGKMITLVHKIHFSTENIIQSQVTSQKLTSAFL
jgi:hypothetical protein